MSFDFAQFHSYISYLIFHKYETNLTDITPYFMGKLNEILYISKVLYL
jgi:hypothetical protein